MGLAGNWPILQLGCLKLMGSVFVTDRTEACLNHSIAVSVTGTMDAKFFSLSTSNSFPLLLQTHFLSPFKAVKFETHCCFSRSIRVSATRTRRKPRPSFFEQIRDKWSLKIPSTREKFPWQEPKPQQQEQRQEETEEEEIERQELSVVVLSKAEIDASQSAIDDSARVSSPDRLTKAPWMHGKRPQRTHICPLPKMGEEVDQVENLEKEITCIDKFKAVDNVEGFVEEVNYEEKFNGAKVEAGGGVSIELKRDREIRAVDNVLPVDNVEGLVEEMNYDENFNEAKIEAGGGVSIELKRDKEIARANYSKDSLSMNVKTFEGNDKYGTLQVAPVDTSSSIELPWERKKEAEPVQGDRRRKRSNTELAEKTLPEHELKRLRNIALRMYERIKVGAAGITQDLVDAIHENWRLNEVVKLKFEEPLSCNMARTHEMLESRTGGLVIWRSGTSAVLYRGTSYKLRCVQSFSKRNKAGEEVLSHGEENVGVEHSIRTSKSYMPDHAKYLKNLSQEELTDFSELNQLLDELGPRFKDWCGREPLPIDADLLPAVDPEYKPPFRLLPHGVRHCLTDKEMTSLRRLAKTVPPHFALGRNRQLQGLAKAMVKLWEQSAIAKIAIKRGVENTRNERMAEELKVLTGGILLSRNKEYIVFYRGNDFLPPAIMEKLKERKKLTYLKQDEEEQARQMALASVGSNAKTSKGPLIAGTLTETMAASSHWRDQQSSQDVDEMLREAVVAKRASLVKHLENKLAHAKGKLKKAEKALAKIHENMDPSELPNDLEAISDEERFLFRRIGLSMKPYFFLGRRGVYDGTIENMHLHWKYRELVKIIVKRKSLSQVKHIAIALEAESGGVLVCVERTTKGHAIIVYRGKNYLRPQEMRPRNLLTKRQALARSIELQRREALKHHILELQERIASLKLETEEMESGKKIDADKRSSMMDYSSVSESDVEERGSLDP